ncbi:MAG: response regulator transcription factor [Cyanobacteria bacterium SBLK]|nr:response regulator transcription factor [Cyanobacteria bacterium SBLK]
MGSVQILIIQGNPHLRSLLGWHLQQAGYICQQADTIERARGILAHRQPPLVVLDSDLPDGDGIELCRWLYRQKQSLILVLSARTNQSDIVAGLEAGADDYLKKPFGMQELLARVEALLRRLRVTSAPLYLNYGDLRIDLVQRRVRLQGSYIDLTPQEFSLLYVLAQAEGTPLSRSELLNRAWPDAIDNPRTIDTHVLSLRKKLDTEPERPSLIQTVRNVGYRFNPESLEGRNEKSMPSPEALQRLEAGPRVAIASNK